MKMSGPLRLRTRLFEIYLGGNWDQMPEKSRIYGPEPKTVAWATVSVAESGFQGVRGTNSGSAQAKKAQLLAVKAELYALNRGRVGLHDYLNNHSGLTEIRFGPLLAELVIKIGRIANQHENVPVVAVLASN